MKKSIYSLVLSDSVVEAVDNLSRAAGVSRSAMINEILARHVSYTTPEMRIRDIICAVKDSMSGEFYLAEQPNNSTFICRSALKYRYKPTIRYSFILYGNGERKSGEFHAALRTQNARLLKELTEFFELWKELERDFVSGNIIYSIENGRFSRTLNLPPEDVPDELVGKSVAEYIAVFDEIVKEYFNRLPSVPDAMEAARMLYYENSPVKLVYNDREVIL